MEVCNFFGRTRRGARASRWRSRAGRSGTRVALQCASLASAHHATRRVWLLGETAPAWRGLFAWAQMKQNAVHTPRNFVHFKLHSLISSHRGLSHAHSELDPAETPRAWHTRVTCCRALVPHAASVVRIVSRSPTQSLHVKSLSSFACLALLSPACLPRVDAVAQLAERAAAHASAGSVVRTRKTFLIANSRNGESTNHYQSATHSAAAASMISPARCDSG